MKTKIIFTLVVLLIVLANAATAESYTATIKIVGVDKEGRGIQGNLTVEIQPGKGRILVDTMPLQGIYTQDSERTAVKVARDITKFDFTNYDVIYTIYTPGATNVEGPSAGGAMALATIAAIQNKTISQGFSMTGTIEEDHSIGKVGEILAKAKAAADSGVSVFLIPEGQATQMQYVRKVRIPSPGWRIETIEPVPVNVIDYAKENWNMKIYEVKTIEEALKYAYQDIPVSKSGESKIGEQIPLSTFASPVKSYSDFDTFAKSAITRGETNYQTAKRKLDSTILTDDVKSELEQLLTRAKELLEEANKLIDQGYKYSAGNNGFKASIYSKTVIDLIDYYSASPSTRSLVIQNKLNQAKGDLAVAKEYVESKAEYNMCDQKNFEWAVLPIERITYAENRIEKIEIENDVGSVFFDINVANEWIVIAKEFSDIFRISQGNTTCLSEFENKARQMISDAENSIGLAESLGIESANAAKPYLDAAKSEYERGWYIASIFDAASAKARATVATKYDSSKFEVLYDVFNKSQVVPSGLLSTIFYEHSMYLMYNAIKDNSREDALEALQILETSKETESAYKYVKNKLASIQESPFGVSISNELINQIIIVTLAVALVILIIYVAELKRSMRRIRELKHKKKVAKIEKEIVSMVEKELKERLKKKEITKKQFNMLRKKFARTIS